MVVHSRCATRRSTALMSCTLKSGYSHDSEKQREVRAQVDASMLAMFQLTAMRWHAIVMIAVAGFAKI